ncbi:DUF6572 domain-containing protein [Bradyrhizobium sp. B120]|uniref:DUF6572 domain-containing protein n=1 Tax=Bradyrhizobium sp. B120 TaxID=3410088 RepID=UPI003B97F593
MSLDKVDVIDAISTARDGSAIFLTIIDGWDWSDELQHLLALQAKFNAYFDFVQSGQIYEVRPEALRKNIWINLLTRHPLTEKAQQFLAIAEKAAAQLNVKIEHRILPPNASGSAASPP